jgi:hypothetical protein
MLALALTGCLALWDHTGPWPCDSDADCQDGQTCQLHKCLAAAGGDGGGPSNGSYCCLEGFSVSSCYCYTPKIACQASSDQGVYASCTCNQNTFGDAGLSETCSLAAAPWTSCCLSTLEGTCNCYANGNACNATLESNVASCTAAATQTTGAGCQVSGGYCSCDSLSHGLSACPSALIPICCQSTSECNCSYNTSCQASEHQVPSCSASALQTVPQCGGGQTLVSSCP